MPRQQHGVVPGRRPVRSGHRARPTVALAPGDPALLLAAPHGRKHPVGGEARGDESLVPPAAISLPRRNATRFAGHMVTRWGAVLRCCDCRPWRRAPLARQTEPPNWPVGVGRRTGPSNWPVKHRRQTGPPIAAVSHVHGKGPGHPFGPEHVSSATSSHSVVYWVPGPFPGPTPRPADLRPDRSPCHTWRKDGAGRNPPSRCSAQCSRDSEPGQ